jgi:hypothetical protein
LEDLGRQDRKAAGTAQGVEREDAEFHRRDGGNSYGGPRGISRNSTSAISKFAVVTILPVSCPFTFSLLVLSAYLQDGGATSTLLYHVLLSSS